MYLHFEPLLSIATDDVLFLGVENRCRTRLNKSNFKGVVKYFEAFVDNLCIEGSEVCGTFIFLP